MPDVIEQDGRCAFDGNIDDASPPFLAATALIENRRLALLSSAHPLTPGSPSSYASDDPKRNDPPWYQPLTFLTPNRPMRPSRPNTPHGKPLRIGADVVVVFVCAVVVVSATGATAVLSATGVATLAISAAGALVSTAFAGAAALSWARAGAAASKAPARMKAFDSRIGMPPPDGVLFIERRGMVAVFLMLRQKADQP